MSAAIIFAALVAAMAMARIESLLVKPGKPVLGTLHWAAFGICFLGWTVVTGADSTYLGLAAAVGSWPVARWMLTDYVSGIREEQRPAAMLRLLDPLAYASIALAVIAPWRTWTAHARLTG